MHLVQSTDSFLQYFTLIWVLFLLCTSLRSPVSHRTSCCAQRMTLILFSHSHRLLWWMKEWGQSSRLHKQCEYFVAVLHVHVSGICTLLECLCDFFSTSEHKYLNFLLLAFSKQACYFSLMHLRWIMDHFYLASTRQRRESRKKP